MPKEIEWWAGKAQVFVDYLCLPSFSRSSVVQAGALTEGVGVKLF